MRTTIIREKTTEKLQEEVNRFLHGLERADIKVLDVQFSSSEDEWSAMIIMEN